MDASALISLALACAPAVHLDTTRALVLAESGLNPWALGVVGGRLERQPQSRREALATARALQDQGWNFSVGLAQINRHNFPRLGLTLESALEPCTNLESMQAVLLDCFSRARQLGASPQPALRMALSCYYSGNFQTGFEHGYVQRVSAQIRSLTSPTAPRSRHESR